MPQPEIGSGIGRLASPEGLQNPELIELRNTAVEAVLASARIVWSYYDGQPVDDSRIEWKADETPKTMADVAGDARIVEILRDKYPHDDILVEESGYHKAFDLRRGEEAQRIWYADSLDGSRPFIEGKPEFTCGVQVDNKKTGEYLVGAIVYPGRRQLLWAVRGHGTYLVKLDDQFRPTGEAKRVHVSSKTSLNGATIAYDSLFKTTNDYLKDAALKSLRDFAMEDAEREGKELTFSHDSFGSNIAYEADVAKGATLFGLTDCIGGIWDAKGGGETTICEAGGTMIDLLTGETPTIDSGVVVYGNKELVARVQSRLAEVYTDYKGFAPKKK